MAATGSLYTYVSKALGPECGVLTSIGLQLGYGFISVFTLASSVMYLRPTLTEILGHAPPTWSLVVLLLGLGTAIVILIAIGIRVTLRFLLLIEGVTSAVVLVIATALLVHLRGNLDWSLSELSSATPQNVGAGTALVITAFVGFESSAALGTEARSPFRDIPRSLVWSVLGVGVLYFLAATAQAVAFRDLNLGSDVGAGAVNQMAAAYGARWIGFVLDFCVSVSFFACAAASSMALVRVLFSLGKEGVLPRRLGEPHPRLQTPVAAAFVTVPAVVLPPVIAVSVGAGFAWIVNASLVVATAGYLLAYALVCAAAPVFLWRLGEVTVLPVINAVVATVTLSGVSAFYLTNAWSDGSRTGVLVFFVGLICGAIYYFWRVRTTRGLRARIGMYDEPVAAEVLGGTPPDPQLVPPHWQ
jgi:amino acid transporter